VPTMLLAGNSGTSRTNGTAGLAPAKGPETAGVSGEHWLRRMAKTLADSKNVYL
jgi:hypothetical protein